MLVPNKTSTAYDFELFDTQHREEKVEIKIKTGVAPAAKSWGILTILFIAVCAVSLPMYILSSKVEISELSEKISDDLILLEKAQSENLRLQSELDNLVTLAKVEEYAKNELGMQKITASQGKHISIGAGETTEIAEDDDNAVMALSKWFSGILEYLGFN